MDIWKIPSALGVGLQFSRSLGDVELARVLNRRTGKIVTIPLGGKGVVLVGTDGLLFPGGETNAVQLKRLLDLVRQGSDAQGARPRCARSPHRRQRDSPRVDLPQKAY